MPAHSCTGRSTARLLIAAVVAVLGLCAGSAAAGQAPARDRDRGPAFAATHAGRAQVARWIGAGKTRLDAATDRSHGSSPLGVVGLAGLVIAALMLVGAAHRTGRSVRVVDALRLPGVRGPPLSAR